MHVFGRGNEGFAKQDIDGVTTTFTKIYILDEFVWWSLQLETINTLTGNWTVDVDNRFSPDPGMVGQPAFAGSWVNIAAANFGPVALAAVAGASKQWVTPTIILPCRAIRVTFARTANTGTVSSALVAKG